MSYRILVSPVSADRKEMLTLEPGENWLVLARDPNDDDDRGVVVRPSLLSGAPVPPNISETCFLCLQYHRGLLLVKDMRFPAPSGAGIETTGPVWQVSYSDDDKDGGADPTPNGGAPAPTQSALLHPRQAIWLPHRGRLMLSQEQGRRSSPPAESRNNSNGGGSQETTPRSDDIVVGGIRRFVPPHCVWLEFWCGAGSGRKVADQHAVVGAGLTTGAFDSNNNKSRVAAEAGAAVVPAATSPRRTKSEAAVAAAAASAGSSLNNDDRADDSVPQLLELVEGSAGVVAPTPPRQNASVQGGGGSPVVGRPKNDPGRLPPKANPPLGSFVYTAESQTPPPPPRRKDDDGGGRRGGGSPGRMAAAAVEPPKKEGELEPTSNFRMESGSSSLPKDDDATPDQSEKAMQSHSQPPIPEREVEKGNDTDVVMLDVEVDPSQGPDSSSQPTNDASAAAPQPPVVGLPPPPTSVLCSPTDELLTQPPERDDPKGPTATSAAAAASQAQDSQVAAAPGSALSPIKEAETREAGNSDAEDDDDNNGDDDDDDVTVDPDEPQGSSCSATGKDESRVGPPTDSIRDVSDSEKMAEDPPPESTSNAVPNPSTPPRRNDVKVSPRRSAGELPSPARSDLESQSLLSPPSAKSKSSRRRTESSRTPPASEALSPIKEPSNPSPEKPAPRPSDALEQQATNGAVSHLDRVDNEIGDASPSLPRNDSDEHSGEDPVNGGDRKPSPSFPSSSEPTFSSKASPSTPKGKESRATNLDTAPTPDVSTEKVATATVGENVKPLGLQTKSSPGASSADEDATVRRSTRKRPATVDQGTRSTTSQRDPPTRKKTRGVEGRRLVVELEVHKEENVEPRGEAASCYVLTTSFDECMSQKIANVSWYLISFSLPSRAACLTCLLRLV